MNAYNGNGAATSTLRPGVSNNFGVGLVGTSKDNLIEKNKFGGNVNGVLIGSAAQDNQIRRNTIVGNPPVQVSTTFGASIGADIQDVSAPGANVFENNRCLTYAGSADPAPCPNISKRDEDEDRQDRDIAAAGATTPFQRALQHSTVARNRLAFPQGRLIDARFHLRSRPH